MYMTLSYFLLMIPLPPHFTFFPYTTLFRSLPGVPVEGRNLGDDLIETVGEVIGTGRGVREPAGELARAVPGVPEPGRDRKSTRLNSSHVAITYAVFCLKKKKKTIKKQHVLT